MTAKSVDDKLLPTVAAQTTNLAQIWLSVIDIAKPSNQKLLTHANLVKLQGDKAILEVTPAYLNKFESSKEAMPTAGYAYAKMLQRATRRRHRY